MLPTRWTKALTGLATFPLFLLVADRPFHPVPGSPDASAESIPQAAAASIHTATAPEHGPAPAVLALGLAARSQDDGRPVAERFAFSSRGTAKNESTDPTRFVLTFPLFSLTTGEAVGTITHNFTCSKTAPPPCAVMDHTDTFRFGNGEIVMGGPLSLAPDPQRPGFVLYGEPGDADNIVSTGRAFAGRTGRVRVFGLADARKSPAEATFTELEVIELNP